MAIKRDKEKAYDKLEWDFIKKCFQDLSFSNQWIDWIWQCITKTTFIGVIVYGKKETRFITERGIRQGDSFLPIFLLLCAKYLGRYIHFMAIQKISCIDIRLKKDTPKIPYLMFADDFIISAKLTSATRKTNSGSELQGISQLVDYQIQNSVL